MCEVLDKVEKRGEEKGRMEGRMEGLTEGQQKFAAALKSLKSRLIADNKIDEFFEAATDVKFAEKLFKQYGIPF